PCLTRPCSLLLSHHSGSPLFPYPTLFRSCGREDGVLLVEGRDRRDEGTNGVDHGGLLCSGGNRRRPGDLGRPSSRKLPGGGDGRDRKSTRLNSSHVKISYAVFCLKKKKQG